MFFSDILIYKFLLGTNLCYLLIWIEILKAITSGCVTLASGFTHSEPQVLHLPYADGNNSVRNEKNMHQLPSMS